MSGCPIPGCAAPCLTGCLVCETHAAEIVAQVGTQQRRSIPAHKAKGWIYYIRLDDKIKIGWSSNLGQRLQSYPPHMVLLTDHPGTRADERDLHRSFKPSRAAGREWYHPTQELLAHIDRTNRAEMERRSTEHWASVERMHGTEHMLRVKAWSERER